MSDHEAPPADPDELDFTDDERRRDRGEPVRRRDERPAQRPPVAAGPAPRRRDGLYVRRPVEPGGAATAGPGRRLGGAQRLEVAETLTRPAMQAVRQGGAATALPRSTASR